MEKSLKAFFRQLLVLPRKDPVLFAAFLLAVVSAFIVPPSAEYLTYIDFRVLALLFALMAVVAGMQKAGLFTATAGYLLPKVTDTRVLVALPVVLCFFFSMLITNDVALITFIPFTLLLFTEAGEEDLLIPAVVLSTVAANMGSCFTPLGNPQNLYLYSFTGMSAGTFMKIMAPPVIVSLLLLLLCLRFISKRNIIRVPQRAKTPISPKLTALWCGLFLLCLLSVLRVIPYLCALVIVLVLVLLVDYRLLKNVNYGLLLTFFFFFIFIGNLKQMPVISAGFTALVAGKELFWGIFASQFISNVPAAMLLAGYAQNAGDLLLGVNIGGLGTLIASMASLISYRYYTDSPGSHIGKYLLFFTGVNMLFLIASVFTVLCLN